MGFEGIVRVALGGTLRGDALLATILDGGGFIFPLCAFDGAFISLDFPVACPLLLGTLRGAALLATILDIGDFIFFFSFLCAFDDAFITLDFPLASRRVGSFAGKN